MKIREIGDVITGKTPMTSKPEYFDGDIMFITPSDIVNGYRIDTSVRHISESGYKSIQTNTISGISILIGCIGSDMGNVALVQERCATNQQINAITNFCENVNPFYVYYLLSMKKIFFQKMAGVTTTPILPKTVLEDIDILLPAKSNQDKVASLLCSIDEKIALNMNTCSELEAMAKTLYDYWFVQFDFPDQSGRPYRTSGGEMVWNEQLKREIPKGWNVGNLYDIADFFNGLACQQFRPGENEDGLPVIKIKEMHDGITHETEFVTERIPEKNKIFDGDILFSWSATLEVMYWFGGNGGLNQHIFKVIPKRYFSHEYVYEQLSAYIINFVKLAEARKTTMGHITTDHLKQSRIALPPEEIVRGFTEVVQPLHSKRGQAKQENRELTKLRDWLLPMLMNGQARVE